MLVLKTLRGRVAIDRTSLIAVGDVHEDNAGDGKMFGFTVYGAGLPYGMGLYFANQGAARDAWERLVVG